MYVRKSNYYFILRFTPQQLQLQQGLPVWPSTFHFSHATKRLTLTPLATRELCHTPHPTYTRYNTQDHNTQPTST